MPSHFHFSFGIGKYFAFKFNFGSRDNSHSSRSDPRFASYDEDLAKKAGIVLYDGKTVPKALEQPECPLFTTIPVEIRHLIYRELLTTPEPIDRAHKQLGSKESAMLDQYIPISNIDACMLRTCRTVYNEALPILYGLNTFQFASSQSIRAFETLKDHCHFQSHGLSTFPLVFNFQNAPTGRLQMIRCLILELKSDYRIFNRGNNISYTRDNIWRDWSLSLFNDDRDSIYPWGGNTLSFPKLEKLTLDFAEWQLTETDGLLVKPFVRKLRPEDGLHELVLKGVKHPGTQRLFKDGLVKESGIFTVINQ